MLDHLHIRGLLQPRQLAEIQKLISLLDEVPGTVSAGLAASKVKSNRVLKPCETAREVSITIKSALMRSESFWSFVIPKSISDPEITTYRLHDYYGQHIDASIFNAGAANSFRTDLAITVFLTQPDQYLGGELVIHGGNGDECEFKCAAGDVVVYPAGFIHEVKPIRAGERTVAVAWAQSLVAESDWRQVLRDLTYIEGFVDDSAHDMPSAKLRLSRAYHQILRLCSSP